MLNIDWVAAKDFINTVGIPAIIVLAYIAERWRWMDKDIKAKEKIAVSLALINNVLEIKERGDN